MSDPNTIAQLLSALTQQPLSNLPIKTSSHETTPLSGSFDMKDSVLYNNSFETLFQTSLLNLEEIRPSSSGTFSLENFISNIKSNGLLNSTGDSYMEKLERMQDHRRFPSDSTDLEGYRLPRKTERDDMRQRKDEYYGRERKNKNNISKTQRRRVKCTKDRSVSPIRKKSSKKHKVTETINIETNFVGLIIGRGGESLKHIEQETGARVQFYPEQMSTMNQRMATISGTQAQVDIAKKRIFSVIEENKILKGLVSTMKNNIEELNKSALKNGYSSIQIYIPNKAVGMVIGKGGESIRDLQERSKTYINIAHENETIHGMRPAYIFGTAVSIQVAKNMIDEIIKTDSVLPSAENSQDLISQTQYTITEGIQTSEASIEAITNKDKEISDNTQDSTIHGDVNIPSSHQSDLEKDSH